MDKIERDRLREMCEAANSGHGIMSEVDFTRACRTAIPAILDALDEAEAKEARLAEHLLRTQQACAIFERNSADVAEMWDRVKAAEGVRDDLRAKLDAAEAIITKHNLCHDLHGRVGRAEFEEGCRRETVKEFGTCGWADSLVTLRMENEELRAESDAATATMQDAVRSLQEVRRAIVEAIVRRLREEKLNFRSDGVVSGLLHATNVIEREFLNASS